jgi:hypothetical protein
MVVGYGEVAEVRNAARAFSSWDALYGGSVIREAVVAQLRYCVELLNARYAPTVFGLICFLRLDISHT